MSSRVVQVVAVEWPRRAVSFVVSAQWRCEGGGMAERSEQCEANVSTSAHFDRPDGSCVVAPG